MFNESNKNIKNIENRSFANCHKELEKFFDKSINQNFHRVSIGLNG